MIAVQFSWGSQDFEITPMERIDGMNLAWCSGAAGRKLGVKRELETETKTRQGVDTTGAGQGEKEIGAEGKNPEFMMG